MSARFLKAISNPGKFVFAVLVRAGGRQVAVQAVITAVVDPPLMLLFHRNHMRQYDQMFQFFRFESPGF